MIYLNFATGFNLPPYWLNRPVKVLGTEKNAGDFNGTIYDGASWVNESRDTFSESDYLGNLYQVPVRIKWADETDYWTLPFDPVVSVACKNIIVRRNVLKQSSDDNYLRGSIKEAWSQDDYEVNIAGVFMGGGAMPEDDLRKLRRYCEARRVIEVESDLFCLFRITRLAVESFDLPHTKGIENQMYTIKAFSDDDFDLFVKKE